MAHVTVEPFGHKFDHEGDETLLEAALRSNLLLKYGCKHGGCGTCKVKLIEGDVDEIGSTFALSSDDRENDVVLACASVALGDCTIDVTPSELTEDEYFSGDTAQEYTSRLASVEQLSRDIVRVRLQLDQPMPFVAGQFVNVQVPSGSWRSFSIANPPPQTDRIELIVKLHPTGQFSNLLQRSQPGEEIRLKGPYGSLRLHASHRPIVMIAGGSGLAPILSILHELAMKGDERDVVLLFGARTYEDLYLAQELRDIGAKLGRFTFLPVLSESCPPGWTGGSGLVTEAIGICGERLAHDAYLCGPPPMIDAARATLIDLGVRPRNIYFDAFTAAA